MGTARRTTAAGSRRSAGWTPVYVRYNTGRRISENGRSLAELLEETVADWPVDVEEIAQMIYCLMS